MGIVNKHVAEIIGEDEKAVDVEPSITVPQRLAKAKYQNDLKTEQRKRASV